jgi:diguanylate cyclase (GGDEF)-like protein
MTPLFANPNLVGLALQAAAVLMIAAMCFTLLKTSPRSPLVAWTAAWIALFVALMVLLLAFRTPVVGRWLQPVYMYFEYVFAYLLFAGCREYATGRRLENRDGWMALVMLIPAIALPAMARWQFNIFYPFHSLLYAYLFFISLRQMARAKATTRGRAGLRVMKVALSVLTVMYTAYAPVFAAASTGWISANPAFLAFSPLYDMLALTLLGFGVVMVTSGDVHSDLERARDLLAGAAQQDPLTSAFNRHAFYAVLDRDLSGTAVFADIDNLKSINDQFGHAAGDAAIRACARALRSHIRADDLLFRWGGDEFLVLLLGVAEADARRRLAGVNDELRHVQVHDDGADLGLTVSISMGFAAFNSAASLDDVIRVADTAMYGIKRRRIG